jgi:hypothetical protein
VFGVGVTGAIRRVEFCAVEAVAFSFGSRICESGHEEDKKERWQWPEGRVCRRHNGRWEAVETVDVEEDSKSIKE